jgi:3-hydroxy acid dehydrogenase / malonic semialdehyde reductase
MNKQIIVTGSSSGIGLSITQQLMRDGNHVIGVSRSTSDALAEEDNFKHYCLDLEKLNELPENLNKLAKQHPDVNSIVFCAGRGQFGSLEEFSFDQISSLMNLNFLSQAYLAKAFVPLFKKRKSGNLIFIGSESALHGSRNGSIYCASKFAVRGMAQALREECSKNNVRVTLINPGMVNSPFFDGLDFEPGEAPENYLNSDDVAKAVSYVIASRDMINIDEINLSPMKYVVRKK